MESTAQPLQNSRALTKPAARICSISATGSITYHHSDKVQFAHRITAPAYNTFVQPKNLLEASNLLARPSVKHVSALKTCLQHLFTASANSITPGHSMHLSYRGSCSIQADACGHPSNVRPPIQQPRQAGHLRHQAPMGHAPQRRGAVACRHVPAAAPWRVQPRHCRLDSTGDCNSQDKAVLVLLPCSALVLKQQPKGRAAAELCCCGLHEIVVLRQG